MESEEARRGQARRREGPGDLLGNKMGLLEGFRALLRSLFSFQVSLKTGEHLEVFTCPEVQEEYPINLPKMFGEVQGW